MQKRWRWRFGMPTNRSWCSEMSVVLPWQLRVDRYDRDARLFDIRLHDAVDRFAGDARHFGPEVLAGRVGEGVLAQVRGDGLAKQVGSDVGLNRAEHGRGLLIRDRRRTPR